MIIKIEKQCTRQVNKMEVYSLSFQKITHNLIQMIPFDIIYAVTIMVTTIMTDFKNHHLDNRLNYVLRRKNDHFSCMFKSVHFSVTHEKLVQLN